MKKFIFFFLFFICSLACLWKTMVGISVCWTLQQRFGCEFAYKSLQWESGELVFSDLVLFDSTFHAHIEKASLKFFFGALPQKLKGHVTLERPHIVVRKERDLPEAGNSFFDLSFAIHEGTLEWGGLVQFSMHSVEGVTKGQLEWENSSAKICIENQKIDVELDHFQAPLLTPWVSRAEVLGGAITGKISFNKDRELASAHLQLEDGAIISSLGSLDQWGGTFSYHELIGAKWELAGVGVAEGKRFPMSFEGKGFFKSRWLDAKLQFGDPFCQISGDGEWTIDCHQLSSEHVCLLQAAVAIVRPEALPWKMSDGILNAKARYSYSGWSLVFDTEHLALQTLEHIFSCQSVQGTLTQDGGNLTVAGDNFSCEVVGAWDNFKAEGQFGPCHLALQGGWDGDKITLQIEQGSALDFQFIGRGWVSSEFDCSFSLDGSWRFLGREIPFYCPILSKMGSDWAFDFRFERKMWDLFRLAGTYDGHQICYSEKSHLLGAPLLFTTLGVGNFDVSVDLPWNSLLSMGPFLQEWGADLTLLPTLEKTSLRLQYDQGKASFRAQSLAPAFNLYVEEEQNGWRCELESDLQLKSSLQKDGGVQGWAHWKGGVEAEFNGKVDPSFHCEFALSKVLFDLKVLQDPKLEGICEGQGHFIYDGKVEADFDFLSRSLVIQSYPLENEGAIHLNYSSKEGVHLSGVHLHGPFDCIVDFVKYDALQFQWFLQGAQIHLPGAFLTSSYFKALDAGQDLNLTADLFISSDFSKVGCQKGDVLLPFNGALRRIENLELISDGKECVASFHYLNHLYRFKVDMDEYITGRLILGEEEVPLSIDWEYRDRLIIHSMEGSFGGVDASFHAESPTTLVGSARIDFLALCEHLPLDVAIGFQEVKMGKGYELKGRLRLEDNLPYFTGILSGKQIEFFGFQFRTLLGRVDLAPKKMRLYDVKISDTAGIFKIDEMLFESQNRLPWTIDVPSIWIGEFRPTLMQKVGGEEGTISPLVIRQLKLTDLKGILSETSSYTAKGNLHFINSYKRESSILDLPVNVLSRIVGIDLELLVPVVGDLEFDLKNDKFYLLELKNAYSEGKRSEFFLEMDPPPCMDLDGNLQIFIKMKQFVLLKITESFLIAIDGQLDDPQFHLTRRRFFGLM